MASMALPTLTASVGSCCSAPADTSFLGSSFLPIRTPRRRLTPTSRQSVPLRLRRRDAPKKTRCSPMTLENDNDESCELVSGTEISLGEDSDSIRAYLFTAVKNNNGAGILLLSDIYGFEDSFTRDFAYRVACNGYNVLVPDLFRGDPWRMDRPRDTLERWLSSHYPDTMQKDIATSKQWMVDEFLAAGVSKKLGVIGFCLGGGRLIEVLAEDGGVHFGVGVSFYGTRIDPSLGPRIKAPVLLITGDEDPLCQVNLLEELQTGTEGSKVVVFEGRGHGFAHRPGSPEEDKDAEQAFLLTRSWLHDGLVITDPPVSTS